MITTNTDGYPFVDIDLARRLEQTEAMGNAKFIEARVKAFPERGATWRRIGGTFAMFDAAGSPLTQTFGLGMFQPVTSEDMDCLLYTSDAADERSSVDLGGRRII